MGHRPHFLKTKLVCMASVVVTIPLLSTLLPAKANLSQSSESVSAQVHSAEGDRLPSTLTQLDLSSIESVTLPGYLPKENGFQFSNNELTQAIQANQRQPEWLSSFTITLMQLFGAQVCVGQDIGQDGQRCILTAAAQNWLASQIDLMSQGLCDGIAAASLFLWEPTGQPVIPWWQKLLGELTPMNTIQIEANDAVLQTLVANQALLQGLDEVYLPTKSIRENLTPNEILAKIADAFRTNQENPYTIGIYRQQAGQLVEGHSLVPYRIEARENNQYRVYVYDSNLPTGSEEEPYISFDGETNAWSYQPAGLPRYQGNAQSKNLDLTRLSWRSPQTNISASADTPDTIAIPVEGPFNCPFCESASQAQPLEIALIGEGQLEVEQINALPGESVSIRQETDTNRVPFKGGLGREVPPSYVLSAEGSDRPFQITISGTTDQSEEDLTLQIVGPGYTASFEELRLAPQETLTMYVAAGEQGPELTFVANRETRIPRLSIHLENDYAESPLETTEPEVIEDTLTRTSSKSYNKNVSYSFDISGISLPAGRSVGLAVDQTLKRFYFTDNDTATNRYTLNVTGRTKEEQITEVETREDFPNGEFEINTRTERRILRYEESLQVTEVALENETLAYFEYGEWAQVPSFDALDGDATSVAVPIVYSPIANSTNTAGSLSLKPQSNTQKTRLYRGNLIKSNYR